jgi:hypothetical protein
MRTEARVYVKGDEVFMSREWAGRSHGWMRRHRFFYNVTPSSLARLQRLYAVRRQDYGPGHYELYRTQYLRQAA